MSLSKQQFSHYVKAFDFKGLFNDMGWNYDKTTQPIAIDDYTYILSAVAEKSGFKVLTCIPNEDGNIPEYPLRKKIETKVTKLFQEHLIIYVDRDKKQQLWQLVVRQTGKPTKMTETRFCVSQDPELLYQRASGLFFEIDEEEKITIVDVTQRVAENFQQNNEKVTKRFYDRFKKEHTIFLSFIQGIEDNINRDWYASLMLNRLMFCYFIQKKGFLDGNKNYLNDKLEQFQQVKGANHFFSFYRHFLLVLFHYGLGSPNHSSELKSDIGIIPYLNGGLFDEHELETLYQEIDIEDKAFERIFKFFDEYEWHLDTRTNATGKEINPDVIGYIFEKYINDRAEMGAYYTKEDITDYISKNCIIPYLFDQINHLFPEAFERDGEVWTLLKKSGDKYIYDSVKYGINSNYNFEDFPENILLGLNNDQSDLIEKRAIWNNLAPNDVSLPSEIWRDVVERRRRYLEIRKKIDEGEIYSITDFITYNLNIRQFIQDIIENTSDAKLIECLYKSLSQISILDPTCGSGAFLFASLNILEPIYEGCLQRMENFIAESMVGDFLYFKEELSQVYVPEHPNVKYFIYKNIILQNLYGVDIMREAVEVAKLRLFLKLVATVDVDYTKPNLGLEPLPDIDFNIRVGNSLVGFATQTELQKGLRYTLDGLMAQPAIEDKCNQVAEVFQRYKEIQLHKASDYRSFKERKSLLKKNLNELNSRLNHLLHQQTSGIKYHAWIEAYQPFHWFAEFYEIINEKGGFDVIVGNPPYVEYSSIKKTYSISNYESITAGNLYAFVIERCLRLMKEKSRIGMIIQMSAFCTPRMEDFQKMYFKRTRNSHIAFFDDRPAKLFDGLEHIRVAIFISEFNHEGRGSCRNIGTTNYIKFRQEFRPILFESLYYVLNDNSRKGTSVLKVNSKPEHDIIEKLWQKKHTLANYLTDIVNDNYVYYGYGYGYFGKILNYRSYFKGEKVSESTGDKFIYVKEEFDKDVVVALLNSSLFYWFYSNYSDGHNFTKHVIGSIPFDFPDPELSRSIKSLTQELMADLKKNANIKTAYYKSTGYVEYEEYYPKKSKHIIDSIDSTFALHYGLDKTELDFIINYDIKYRMGITSSSSDED
jgi:hypothetical protein